MTTMTMKRYALILAALLPIGVEGLTYTRFRTAMRCGRKRLLNGSHTVATEYGDIEYAIQGSGLPVLLLHGAGGGYDQCLLIGEFFVGNDYHFIAHSRFGYVRSTIPECDSPATQADAYAALLGMLGVERVAVVAFSDGGPSELQFALWHPDLCAALVMISAKSQTPPPVTPLQALVFWSIFRSDYLFWLITENVRSFLLSMFGVSCDVQKQATAGARRLVSDFLDSMHPISLRKEGIYNDMDTMAVLPDEVFRLEQITMPTLVIHTVDDGLQPYSHGVNTATRVPDAEFISYEQGGHHLRFLISSFIRKNPLADRVL